ncbi:MAG: hypothetical protein Ct9H90mP2_15820 [Dehalococcoidia bacterium]|nr:MAG: hypothetical protein Ct9H90mP2_15820 [Dehalococcoidia bacterium]
MIGNEVEEIITTGDIPGVIVAEIKEIIPHPNADKLQLAKIFDGKNTLSVVCGAPNIKEGQKKISCNYWNQSFLIQIIIVILK